jgi:hypothetical protein
MIQCLGPVNSKILTTTLAIALAASLPGCKKADYGPKQADYKQAHTAHYHPDVKRSPGGTVAASQPEATTRPADFRFGGKGPAGTPILFVNTEAITIPEVLEPLYDDLVERSKSLSEASYRDYLIRRVVDQVNLDISRVIIFQEAKTTFPDKADEAFAKETDKIIREMIDNRYGGVHARYEEHLKTVGVSAPEMKERIKKQLMVSQYLHEHFKPLIQNPSRAELFKYYQQHKADFATAPRAELFIVEIPLEAELQRALAAATPEQIAAARQRALTRIRRAREELDSGVEFAEVARQYSRGLQAARGGEVGEISPGSMTARYSRPVEALFKLEAGGMSDPIETADAVFLVKCGKKTPGHQGSFEESQAQIRNKLMDEQFEDLQRSYIARLEAKSVIRRRNEFLIAVLSAAPRPAEYEKTAARPGAEQPTVTQ